MSPSDLHKLTQAAQCRVFGWEDAQNDAQRLILGLLIRGFPSSDSSILCEPSLVRTTKRPPDVVLVDSIAGVHVIEVKGHDLSQIEAIDPGGQLRFRYQNGVQARNPIAQVRNAMFDVKNATEQSYEGDLSLPFKYWVAFPRISSEDWKAKWGDSGYYPPEFLFTEDMDGLAHRLREFGEKRLANVGINSWPSDQIAAVWKAFGDSAVLFHRPEEREGRRVEEGTLGELFDEAAQKYKNLSEEQQKLSAQNWNAGPRLIRGVAGSGKTIVLANNLARRIQRHSQERGLFEEQPPRILAVCNNRSLVPFLKKKIALAYEQRTGDLLPEKGLDVLYFNGMLYELAKKGFWRYQRVEEGTDEQRVEQYIQDLEVTKKSHADIFEAHAYDAVFVDEGQDFLERQIVLLKELCRVQPSQEPNIYVFYDDAQNFLGRKRPNWSSVGLNVRGGRSHIMSLCFRNTCNIVEAAFNVLYGSCADGKGDVPTKEFGDIATLEEKHAIVRDDDGYWRVGFAVRDGLSPKFTLASSAFAETQQIVERLRWLIEKQKVRPQDILVLGFSRGRIEGISAALAKARIAGVEKLHIAFKEQDKLLGEKGTLTLSTTASAKGYDAYCVLLASANEFDLNALGRISFYVGCTRAIEYLEVFAYSRGGLAAEWERVLEKQRSLLK